MQKTKIQWCHSTVNPVMGCDGCELWPTGIKIDRELIQALQLMRSEAPALGVEAAVHCILQDRPMSRIYAERKDIATRLQRTFKLNPGDRAQLVDLIRGGAKCYAGLLGTMRAAHKGYADQFEHPKQFAGRVAQAALWPKPGLEEQAAKPWLAGTPRMIFLSDMGDALSQEISLEYLQEEIINPVSSPAGRRHLWLWLTKRPGRMARFGTWLAGRGIPWPENLVAMTTVTSQKTAGRIQELLKVTSRFKGLSVEPLFGAVHLPLAGIDWVIVGGGSDVLAEPFHCEWAMDIRRQCQASGAAFFLKQLGKHPFHHGKPLKLADRHGGDWSQWPESLRARDLPQGFRECRAALGSHTAN